MPKMTITNITEPLIVSRNQFPRLKNNKTLGNDTIYKIIPRATKNPINRTISFFINHPR